MNVRRPGRSQSKAAGGASIKDVARAAGVSLATVSRVLNGSGPVSQEKRQRVWQAVEALGYVPHGGARSLVKRRTDTVALVLPELSGDFYSQLLRGAELAARRLGVQLLVSGFHGSAAEVKKALSATRGRVDGIALMWPEVEKDGLMSAVPPGSPLVLLGGAHDQGLASMALDNAGGARAAVQHLLDLGHRVIAHLQGPPTNLDALERQRAFETVVREAGAQAMVVPGDFSEEGGFRAAEAILALNPRPTAVFAANDASAIGLILGLRAAGVRVPDEISVVGFDDIPLARLFTPALTTVCARVEALGAAAVETVVALRSNPNQRIHRRLPTGLVVRASSAPPPTVARGAHES